MSEPLTDRERLRRIRAIIEHGGNRSAAADQLGLKANTLRKDIHNKSISDLQAEAADLEARLSVPETEPEANLGLIERLLSQGSTLEAMAHKSGATSGAVLDEIDRLISVGKAVVRHGDVWRITKEMRVGNVDRVQFQADDRNRIKFGISSDKHYGSKYCREDVIDELYQWFADEGVAAVLDAGNFIEGESSFNRYDLKVHGLEQQARYLAENLPEHDGLTTYAVAGDDHEGWYAKREGVDIGRYVESTFRHLGREDWVNLGYMEAYLDIVNASTGVTSTALVMHPGGGSAYAHSYKPQKIVEALGGGEKPALLLIGHYHKLSVNLIRNVWAVQCGCAQDQTPFMRKKSIDAHIGGMIIELEQDPETGALIMCRPEIRMWFNRGYYNNRWSPHGTPNLPEREINRG